MTLNLFHVCTHQEYRKSLYHFSLCNNYKSHKCLNNSKYNPHGKWSCILHGKVVGQNFCTKGMELHIILLFI